MSTRAAAVLLLVVCGVGLGIAVVLGVGYAERNAFHAGFYRVTVHDPGPSVGIERPRRTVVFVVDGLGHIEAEGMTSLGRLAEIGQCRTTAVGPLSVSRPVYAVLSTGLDQDRTGARGNDDTTPLAAQSIWEIARHAGLRVAGISEVPWWQELFPDGFDVYDVVPPERDYVPLVASADLQLVHPVYVDDVGHDHGAASAEYADAVTRVDREIAEMIATLDFSRDLLVVTADHGQMLHGGHGGRQPRVAWVRTCFAGLRVAHGDGPMMRTTTIAPALSVLLGLPFPADMRAGDDEFDTIFSIVDERSFPSGYLQERRETIDRFRARNAAQLRAWMPESDGRWSRFRDGHRRAQAWGLLPCALAALVVLALYARAQRRQGRALAPGLTLIVLLPTLFLVTQIVVRGSFDLGSVSTREVFLTFTIGMAVIWCGIAIAALVRVRGSLEGLVLDWAALSAIGTILAVVHPLVFGWIAGYPAPPAELFFYPYFVTLTFGVVQASGVLIGGRLFRASGSAAKR